MNAFDCREQSGTEKMKCETARGLNNIAIYVSDITVIFYA